MVDTVYLRNDDRRHDTVHFVDCRDMDRETARAISRVTWAGAVVNIMLAVIKATAGVLSGSRVLIADAVHTISDLATDFAIIIGVKYWSAPADAEHPHGHRKIETLVTLLIGMALAGVGVGMGYQAVRSIVMVVVEGRRAAAAGVFSPAEWAALAAALLSLVSKELLYRWTAAKGVQLGSTAVVANAWHHRSDALSSIPPALVIGANLVASRYGHDLWYLDPIGTIVVCVMLLGAAWEVVGPTFGALLDASADRKLCSGIRNAVLTTPGVAGAHRIRTRCIGSGAVAVDLHIFVNPKLTVEEGHRIAASVKYRILGLDIPAAKAKAVDVMVHVEPADSTAGFFPGRPSANTKADWKTMVPRE